MMRPRPPQAALNRGRGGAGVEQRVDRGGELWREGGMRWRRWQGVSSGEGVHGALSLGRHRGAAAPSPGASVGSVAQ